MPNSYITHFAQFNPLSYDELMKPVQSATTQHNTLADSYADLEAMSSAIGENLDPDRDAPEYLRYMDYINQLQGAAKGLMNKGIIGNPSAFDDARKAKATYGASIAPIAEQITARKEYIKNELDKKAKDPTYISTFDNPNEVSVTSFANGNQPINFGVSGNNLYALGKAATTAASAREIDLGAWSLDPNLLKQYFSRITTKGFSNDDILNVSPSLVEDMAQWLNSKGEDYYKAEQDSSKLLNILRQSYYRIASENQLQTFNDFGRPDLTTQANQWIMSGLIDGITYDKTDKQLEDKNYMDPLKWAQYKKLTAPEQPDVPQFPLRTKPWQSSADKEVLSNSKTLYSKYFSADATDASKPFYQIFTKTKEAVGGAYPTTPQFSTTNLTFAECLKEVFEPSESLEKSHKEITDKVTKELAKYGIDIKDFKDQSFAEAYSNIAFELQHRQMGGVNTDYYIAVAGGEGENVREPIATEMYKNLNQKLILTDNKGNQKKSINESGTNAIVKKIDPSTGKAYANNGIKNAEDLKTIFDPKNISTFAITPPKIDFNGVISGNGIDPERLALAMENYKRDIDRAFDHITVETQNGDRYYVKISVLDGATQARFKGMKKEALERYNYIEDNIEDALISEISDIYKSNTNLTDYQLTTLAADNVAQFLNSSTDFGANAMDIAYYYGMGAYSTAKSVGRNFTQTQEKTSKE